MRLIDADALIEKIDNIWNGRPISFLGARILAMIDETPTIEADRPKGEWIKHDEERDYCSCCKHIFKTRTITKQDKWTNYIDDLGYNYCPNCGARMKGADDE